MGTKTKLVAIVWGLYASLFWRTTIKRGVSRDVKYRRRVACAVCGFHLFSLGWSFLCNLLVYTLLISSGGSTNIQIVFWMTGKLAFRPKSLHICHSGFSFVCGPPQMEFGRPFRLQTELEPKRVLLKKINLYVPGLDLRYGHVV